MNALMRPQFHFTAVHGWINDPHAVTYRNGQYHLFYQYIPGSAVWSLNCHWGHAVGSDLFDTVQLPIALAPGEGDDGIWTGSLVTDDKGVSRIFYTSVVQPDIGIGRVRVATPKDDAWTEWDKGDVVAVRPPHLDIVAYRDPFVFRDGDVWRMFVGASRADGTAMALSYTSPDLVSWDYEKVAAHRSITELEPVWTGALWECPQLFHTDGRSAIVTSIWADDMLYYAAYGIGSYVDGTFTAETWAQLSYGPSYYAPSFFRDAAGRPCLIFWMRGVMDERAGWFGAHSIPYVLEQNGELLTPKPHPDLAPYISEVRDDDRVDGLAAYVDWAPQPAGDLLTVRSGEQVVFTITIADGALTLGVHDEHWSMPFDGGDVVVVVDGPIVEIVSGRGIIGSAISVFGAGLAFGARGTASVHELVK
jgi:beta-fructofuranosidase